jgi:glutamate-1-semialdehyde aminotransferase
MVSESWKLHDRALKVIPLATQTHSKAPRETLRGAEPCYLVRGKGCRVWDLDGNEYIDFRSALGPITLGYQFPAVDEAIHRQLESGIAFSYPHPLEVDVAERLVEIIPCAESVRFLKTGGEAMTAAHRLSRAFTGRDLILTCGYHGWLSTTSRPGVPEAIRSVYRELPWGDIAPYTEAFERSPGRIAAVSVACSYADIEAGHTFLADLRALTRKHGTLLILDEIVTGFRLSLGGAEEYFDVAPDLAVFAKGISNGVPLSCYVGRRDVMGKAEEAAISSTFGGDTLGLAAAKAVLKVYDEEDVIGTIWARGRQLHQGFNDLCRRLDVPASFNGLPPLGQLTFNHTDTSRKDDLFLRFNAEVLRRGVIIYAVCYPTYAHAEADVEEALRAMGDSLSAMRDEGLFG